MIAFVYSKNIFFSWIFFKNIKYTNFKNIIANLILFLTFTYYDICRWRVALMQQEKLTSSGAPVFICLLVGGFMWCVCWILLWLFQNYWEKVFGLLDNGLYWFDIRFVDDLSFIDPYMMSSVHAVYKYTNLKHCWIIMPTL